MATLVLFRKSSPCLKNFAFSILISGVVRNFERPRHVRYVCHLQHQLHCEQLLVEVLEFNLLILVEYLLRVLDQLEVVRHVRCQNQLDYAVLDALCLVDVELVEQINVVASDNVVHLHDALVLEENDKRSFEQVEIVE